MIMEENTQKTIDYTEHLKKTIELGNAIQEREAALIEKENQVDELKKIIVTLKEFNVKLAYSTKLFAEIYFTKDEKIAIAQEIDRAISDEQVKDIYAKYASQAVTITDAGNNDFIYSKKFAEDIEKHYFQSKGKNTFETISVELQPFRFQFRIEEEMRNAIEANDQEKLNELKASWESVRSESENALGRIDAILKEEMGNQ